MQEVILSVTNRCNLKCAMCDIPLGVSKEVSHEALAKAIDDLRVLKPESVVFSGGEPMLRKDIYKLIYKAHENGFRTCLTTNGVLVDSESARKLKKAGLDIANVSIEGSEEIHDAIRGEGTYQKAVNALKVLWEAGVETTVAFCVSKKNYQFMPEAVSLASKVGATTVKFQAFSVLFMDDTSGEGFFIDDEKDVKDLKKVVLETLKKAKELNVNVNPESYLNRLPLFLSSKVLEDKTVKYGCKSLYDVVSVNAAGELLPCFMLPDMVVGNLENESLKNIWNSKKHQNIREYIKEKGCSGCLLSCYEDDFTPVGFKGILKKLIFFIFPSLDKKGKKHSAKLKEIEDVRKRFQAALK